MYYLSAMIQTKTTQTMTTLRTKDELINSIWDKVEKEIETLQNEVFYVEEQDLAYYKTLSGVIDDLFNTLNNTN